MSTDNSYLASSSPISDTSRTGSYGGSITPKALTTYITSQISRAVRSVDWSNDTESGASAIKTLIGMAGLVKERLQTEESGPDSGSSDGGESKNAAGEITIKPPASETSIATPRYSSAQDSSRPPWESATTPSTTGKVSPSPVPPESLFPSITRPPPASPQSPKPSTQHSTTSGPSSSPTISSSLKIAPSSSSSNLLQSASNKTSSTEQWIFKPLTEIPNSIMELRGDGDRPQWPRGKGRQFPTQGKA
ncbi:hypothetical protein LQV05_006503 [Cryptococcus neoformans]|nr:hypothetical protein LQV05_006503 [Cryptococcus neoformans]